MSTPADDTGDVAALQAEIADLREKVEFWVDERDLEIERGDEARADADRLRAENETLTKHLSIAHKAEDRVREVLGKVARVLGQHGLHPDPTGCLICESLQAIGATDPVSLADDAATETPVELEVDDDAASPVSLADVREGSDHE